MTPRDGLDWLRKALYLMASRPGLFIGAALLAPLTSALLLAFPMWDTTLPVRGWLPVMATVICYGLPLSFVVSLACGFARATDRHRDLPLRRIVLPSVLKILGKSSLFLFALLLQGYLAAYLMQDLVSPAAIRATPGENPPATDLSFALADTILGTQLGMLGGLLLVLQLLFACFVVPLYLFRELPVYTCWRLSFLAIQLNPWLWPAIGLPGVLLILFSSFEVFAVVAQILALPLPVYLGTLLYVAWLEVFQGGIEDKVPVDEEAIA